MPSSASLLLTRAGRSRLVFASDSFRYSDIQDTCDTLWSLNALKMDGELVCSSPPLRVRTRGLIFWLRGGSELCSSHKPYLRSARRFLNAASNGIVRSYVRRWGVHWVSLKEFLSHVSHVFPLIPMCRCLKLWSRGLRR